MLYLACMPRRDGTLFDPEHSSEHATTQRRRLAAGYALYAGLDGLSHAHATVKPGNLRQYFSTSRGSNVHRLPEADEFGCLVLSIINNIVDNNIVDNIYVVQFSSTVLLDKYLHEIVYRTLGDWRGLLRS